jgi:hypothetical protein
VPRTFTSVGVALLVEMGVSMGMRMRALEVFEGLE